MYRDGAVYFPHGFFQRRIEHQPCPPCRSHEFKDRILLCICQLSPASSGNVPLKALQFLETQVVYATAPVQPAPSVLHLSFMLCQFLTCLNHLQIAAFPHKATRQPQDIDLVPASRAPAFFTWAG